MPPRISSADLKKNFSAPPVENSPAYFWFINSAMEENSLREKIMELAAHGSKVICPHPLPPEFNPQFGSTMTPGYLSDEYFEKFSIIVDECKKHGLKLYIYDEGGWPSGSACGQVWASDPENFTRQYVTFDSNGDITVEKEKFNPAGKPPIPDILHPGVTEKFIELTHERYFARFGKDFGDVILFAFTDEPSYITTNSTRLTWTADFAEEFKKRKGYDVTPFLPDILNYSATPQNLLATIDFHDVKSHLFAERYMLPLRNWCRKHNICFTGHMNGEDEPENMANYSYGQIMRSLRLMDAPGVDVIWRQLFQGSRLATFPKFASSAAHQTGNSRVVGEMFGVYGSGLTFQQMQFLTGYMLVCGVNTFVSCTFSHSTQGLRMAGERPHFGKVNPLWKHIEKFHLQTTRYAVLSVNSCPQVDTALFLDTRSYWIYPRFAQYSKEVQQRIANALLENQCDFDYIDDDVLATAEIENGFIRIGEARYRTIVLPVKARISPDACANLEKLRAAGADIRTSETAHTIAPTLEISPRDPNFRVRKHLTADGDAIYFVLNTANIPLHAGFQCIERAPVVRFDADSGKLFTAGSNGRWQYDFAPGEFAVFMAGPGAADALPLPPEPGEVIKELSGQWQLAEIRRFTVGTDDYCITETTDAVPRQVMLGDWSGALGKDFSGEAEYIIKFDFDSSAGFIDLGKVNYTAELILNGISLGVKLAPPYCFATAGALKKGENILKIRVTNTLANAISAPGVLEKWRQYLSRVTSYEGRSRIFEAESFASGLFGPVTLKK